MLVQQLAQMLVAGLAYEVWATATEGHGANKSMLRDEMRRFAEFVTATGCVGTLVAFASLVWLRLLLRFHFRLQQANDLIRNRF